MSVLKENANIKFLHIVRVGQTLEDIAKIYNKNVELIKSENQIENCCAGDLLTIPLANENIYVAQPMDTLLTISKKLNVSIEHLKLKNNCKQIFIGQKIRY